MSKFPLPGKCVEFKHHRQLLCCSINSVSLTRLGSIYGIVFSHFSTAHHLLGSIKPHLRMVKLESGSYDRNAKALTFFSFRHMELKTPVTVTTNHMEFQRCSILGYGQVNRNNDKCICTDHTEVPMVMCTQVQIVAREQRVSYHVISFISVGP